MITCDNLFNLVQVKHPIAKRPVAKSVWDFGFFKFWNNYMRQFGMGPKSKHEIHSVFIYVHTAYTNSPKVILYNTVDNLCIKVCVH